MEILGPYRTIDPYATYVPIKSDHIGKVGCQLIVPAQVGDVFGITSTVQLTNPNSVNVMAGKYLTVGALERQRKFAVNITPGMHHFPTEISSYVQISPDMAHADGNYYVRHWVYADCSQSVDPLIVDYADMTVVVFRSS